MPTPKKGARLGGSPAHQKLILKNLATQLIEHRSLTTTETKAKRGDIHARRTVARVITDRDALYTLFDVIAPALDPERKGGYTRLTRLGNRKGDNAPMMQIEFCMEAVEKKAVVKSAEKAAEKAAAAEVAAEAEEAAEAAAERAEEAREEGDLAKANEAEEIAAEAGEEADAAEQVEEEK